MNRDVLETIGWVIVGVVVIIGLLVLVAAAFLGLGMMGLWAFNAFGYFLPWTWDKAIAAAVIIFIASAIFS
jgi:hypothetical protein